MAFKALLLIVAVLLPDWLLWKKYFRGRGWVSWLWWLPAAMLAVCTLGALSGGLHSFFMRAVWFLAMFSCIPKIAFFSLCYINKKLATVMTAITYLVFIYGILFGFYNLKIREEVYESPNVPEAFDGYRIVHLSDIHIGTLSEGTDYLQRIVDSVKALKPDLVVMTGDLVNVYPSEVEPFISTLSQIKAPDGVFSVLGNHDYGFSKADVDKNAAAMDSLTNVIGWKLLNNANSLITRDKDSLYIIGTENISRGFFVSRGDLSRAMEGIPEGKFKILLTHDPHHWDDEVVPDTDIDLTLSGHTHGMQFKVGRLSPAMFMFKHWGGKYLSEDGRMINVSEGVGGIFPFRIGAWPEIVLISLKHIDN